MINNPRARSSEIIKSIWMVNIPAKLMRRLTVVGGLARKSPRYRVSAEYRRFIGGSAGRLGQVFLVTE
jgi:hypothetical protein